jgi:ferredoxin-type protein NapH
VREQSGNGIDDVRQTHQDEQMKRQSVRKLLLLLSFSAFPVTIVYLAPAPPVMSLEAGVINLSVLTILAIFISGFVFRRTFCGWLCPGGGCQLVAHALNNRRIGNHETKWFRIILVSVWVVVMIGVVMFGEHLPKLDVAHPGAGKFAASNIRYFLPYIPTVVFIFLFVFLFGRRGFCHRGCWIYPIIASSTGIATLIHAPNLHVAVKDGDACKNCKLCTEICPMSIDVHERVQTKMGLPNDCIQCGLCVDRCSKDVLSFSFGIEERWSGGTELVESGTSAT